MAASLRLEAFDTFVGPFQGCRSAGKAALGSLHHHARKRRCLVAQPHGHGPDLGAAFLEGIERQVFGVRTGSFLAYPSYARKTLKEPQRTGSPIVILYSRKHLISINTSGYPAYD